MSFYSTVEQVQSDKKYVVVNNPFAEVQESEITSAEASTTPVVKEKFTMVRYCEENKSAPKKSHHVIAFAALVLLVAILLLGVIALCVAFALEIPKLNSETDQLSSTSA